MVSGNASSRIGSLHSPLACVAVIAKRAAPGRSASTDVSGVFGAAEPTAIGVVAARSPIFGEACDRFGRRAIDG